MQYLLLFLTSLLMVLIAKHPKIWQRHSIHNCEEFNSVLKKVRSSVHAEEERSKLLEKLGLTYADNIFGAAPTYDTCSANIGKIARLHTVAAQYFKDEYNLSEDQFKNYVAKCNANEPVSATCRTPSAPAPKYRPIDGRGNNLNNPEWGASDTPFARFGPKGYADGVNVPKKALSGAPLPNPRKIVEEALTKATRAAPPPLAYGVFALMTVLFITHDVHYQTAVQPVDAEREIQCCLDDRSKALPPYQSHPSCFPIEIAKNDTLYQQGGVGCISLVRSERAEYTDQVQAGEIMNRATSFLDLSLIYGNHQSELDPIRLYSGGLFRMGRNNLLPVDSNGKYIPSMRRFTMVPMASIWPSLFARNHNYLAQGLAEINPQWDDETLFQEARRINIALFQYNLITSKAVEASISNIPIKEEYDETRNAATTLEFSIAYRMAHYYIHDNMLWQDENLNEKRVLQSDTIGRIDLLEDDFDGALRGSLGQLVNAGEYGDEVMQKQITNRIGKTSQNGYGADIISMDIQRARDQGLPCYLDVRRKCNLQPEINSFADLKKIMQPENVELLQKVYEAPEDIDYYVGGIFETYEILGNPLVGPTFGCVIARQWDNFAGGDIYYYSNPNSPYPLTPSQIDAVHNFNISSLLCVNSNMDQTAQVWPYAPNEEVNPLRKCSEFPTFDFAPWKVPNAS
ncbi:Peroxidase [Pseudolycoriella hygida]|uniref:Peroxidase n=1 Tax=Pseudolycoriella hygida TaxID=35572 RepID=A0A9Q0S2P9_9DIPT|nr:Peroxidase [Pseudolycoriella hygida]